MDFRRKRIVKTEQREVSEIYPHDLQLYKIPPIGEVSLEEFDELAIERLQVLRIIELVYVREGGHNMEEVKKGVLVELKKFPELKSCAKLVRENICKVL